MHQGAFTESEEPRRTQIHARSPSTTAPGGTTTARGARREYQRVPRSGEALRVSVWHWRVHHARWGDCDGGWVGTGCRGGRHGRQGAGDGAAQAVRVGIAGRCGKGEEGAGGNMGAGAPRGGGREHGAEGGGGGAAEGGGARAAGILGGLRASDRGRGGRCSHRSCSHPTAAGTAAAATSSGQAGRRILEMMRRSSLYIYLYVSVSAKPAQR